MKLYNLLPRPNDHLEEKANAVLSHFNFKTPNEVDLSMICWHYGIKIVSSNGMSFSVPTKNRRGVIYLQKGLRFTERRVICAEEFSHLYLHFSSQINNHYRNVGKVESQAKRMAAYLLMPQYLLEKFEFGSFFEQEALVAEVADYFRVTEEFAYYRLEMLSPTV